MSSIVKLREVKRVYRPETSKPVVESSIFELNSRNLFEEDVGDIEESDDVSSVWGYEVNYFSEGGGVLLKSKAELSKFS